MRRVSVGKKLRQRKWCLLVFILFTSPIAAFGEEAALCAPGDNKDDCKGGLDSHVLKESERTIPPDRII